MNEGGAINLQIEQDWIQHKGMHPLYHDQVVSAMLMLVLLQRIHENGQPS